MSKEQSPAFQFYAADYLSDINTQLMTPEEEGCYLRLMCYCWREGDLPADREQLKALCKGVSLSDRVAMCFELHGDRLRHKRLDSERQRQADFRQSKSEAGAKGNVIRWGKKSKRIIAQRSHSDTSAIAKDRSSSSSSSSNNNSLSNAEAKAAAKRKSHTVPADFVVTAEMREELKGERPDVDIDLETRKFRDHEFKDAHSNWVGVWKNWIRRANGGAPAGNGWKPGGTTPNSYQQNSKPFAGTPTYVPKQ